MCHGHQEFAFQDSGTGATTRSGPVDRGVELDGVQESEIDYGST